LGHWPGSRTDRRSPSTTDGDRAVHLTEGRGVRRIVTAATSLCLLLGGTSLPARAAGNSPPVAVDDPGPACGGLAALGGSYPVVEDAHDWALLALGCRPLINDTDPDGDPLSVELVGQPAHGQAQVIPGVPDDWLEYRPAHDYSTPRGDEPGGSWVSDVVTYRAFDGQAYSNEASYRLWVAPVNDPPSFTPGPALIETTAGGGPVSVQWATDVSPGPANESDQSVHFELMVGAPDDIFAVKPTIDADGVLTFTPGTKPWLSTIYGFAKDDGGLEDWNLPPSALDAPDDISDELTFQIAIYPAPQAPPVAVDDALTVLEDTPGTISVIDNDTDINDDLLAVASVGAAGKGTATKDATHTWWADYTPSQDANGSDSFEYTVSDGHGGTDTGTVHVTITPVNDDPVAGDDSVVVAEGATDVPLLVLDNDDDVDGDTLAVTDASGASHGSLDTAGGGLTYTPSPGYAGPDAFTYTVSDGAGGHATASVAVTVSPDAVPPVLSQLADALGGGRIGASTVPVRLSWHGTDAVTGVAAYQLQQRAAGGTWRTIPLASARATSITRSLAVGEATRFRVRAKDGGGNWSPYTAWAPIVPQRRQEGSAAIAWTGPWHPTDDARFSGGRARHATVHARRATFTFSGHGIGLVSRRSPGAGRAEIRVDGSLVATIDLSGPMSYRRIAFHRELATGGAHAIEVRPLGNGRVDIDAFIVLP
jgi:Bacterial Ig domain